jgi:hypothetical protein
MPSFAAGANNEFRCVRVNATSDGANNVIATPGAGKAIRVLGFCLVNATTAGVSTIQDTAGTPAVHASFDLAKNGGVSYAGGQGCPAFQLAANTGLDVSNATGADLTGFITYQVVRS